MKNEVHDLAGQDEIKEAIDSLYYFISGECTGNQFDLTPDIVLAAEALKKCVPIEPIGKYTDFRCAICGRRVRSGKGSSSRIRDNYCQRCGQRLDWSVQNE